jgi:hypothetical protein
MYALLLPMMYTVKNLSHTWIDFCEKCPRSAYIASEPTSNIISSEPEFLVVVPQAESQLKE